MINKTEIFIEKANDKHDNKYYYSNVRYIDAHTKIKITCKIHGDFEQTPNGHLNGNGCSKCFGRGKRNNDFIEKANKKHNNKYEYSKLPLFIIEKDKIKITCKIHGDFEQRPSAHLNGDGCPKCGGSEKLNSIEFIYKAKEIHGNKYDYSLVTYINNKTKVKIICEKHGLFGQKPNHHLLNQGCPICKESKGEKMVKEYLETKKINYIREKKINGCKNINDLPFDFYLPDYNICIEYDGRQHFEPIIKFGGEVGFNKIKTNDEIKNNFCKDNKIKLIRISYKEKVKDKLSKENV